MTISGSKLEVRDLDAGYGQIGVVHDLSIDVEPGQLTALVGRNGVGKTTAVLAIGGRRYGRSRGRVSLGGEDLSGLSAHEVASAGVAVVPENHRVFPSLTVRENVKLGAFSRRSDRSTALRDTEEIVYELFPDLREMRGRHAGNLSGGQQQMLAIGQALMAQPKVLLLDEPSSGLAAAIVDATYDVLRLLQGEGLGVLIVEQNIQRALAESDHCYVLDQGRLVLSGPSRALDAKQVSSIVLGLEVMPLESSDLTNGPQVTP